MIRFLVSPTAEMCDIPVSTFLRHVCPGTPTYTHFLRLEVVF
jgi:hypothetical protein